MGQRKIDPEKYNLIKKDYISSKISLRQLADKYNEPVSTVRKVAHREGWMTLRIDVESECNQNIKEQVVDIQTKNADKAFRICEKLLDKIEASVDIAKPGDCTALKQITTSLKDLKELGVFGGDSKSNEITIKFDDGVDAYGE